jgi:CHASE2 domain-containing sensor protein/predicted Ser/Thr protein kinase
MTRLRYISPLLTILAALVLAAGIWWNSDLLRRLELPVYDRLLRWRPFPTPPTVVVIAIDEVSLDARGDWPWPRHVIAEALQQLSAAGVAAVGLDLFWGRPECNAGLDTQGHDDHLRTALAESGQVILPLEIQASAPGAPPMDPLPPRLPVPCRTADLIRREPLVALPLPRLPGGPMHRTAPATRIRTPWGPLAEAALALGHRQVAADPDGRVRRVPLFIEAGGNWYPSQALLLATRLRGLPHQELQIIRRTPGTSELRWGTVVTPLDGNLHLNLGFPPPQGRPPTLPIQELLSRRIPPDALKGRIVILGLTARGTTPLYPTPWGEALAPAELTALAVASLVSSPAAVRPYWASLLEMAILAYVLVFFLLAMPRIPLGVAAGILGGLTLTWGAAGAAVWVLQGTWLWLWPPALLALIGLLLQGARGLQDTLWRQRLELNRTLGLAFQARGLLDQALEKFLECPPSEPGVPSLLFGLAQEFERKRRFPQAARVYEAILKGGRHRAARQRLRQLEAFAGSGAQPAVGGLEVRTSVLTDGVASPTFGRYEIVRELGQGAMGTVFLGRDPRINREVAIKTLGYADVPAAELEEIKERFFREAEAAGKLAHPNIVTVFDVGEEHDSAYMAMEFLEGDTLAAHCQRDQRLPLERVLEVVESVAEALAYAHARGVVHRDIKPANIMLLGDGRVKVLDFGIARIRDAARTRTGIVMGTPGYMSPEQVAGKRVDDRSDLFSLGIVFYELLSGQRPFPGESLATVMARIARTPHTPLREIIPGLPPCCEGIVDKLLAKGLTRRYRSASRTVDDLRRCREALGSRP